VISNSGLQTQQFNSPPGLVANEGFGASNTQFQSVVRERDMLKKVFKVQRMLSCSAIEFFFNQVSRAALENCERMARQLLEANERLLSLQVQVCRRLHTSLEFKV
jgi:hypothetical protein